MEALNKKGKHMEQTPPLYNALKVGVAIHRKHPEITEMTRVVAVEDITLHGTPYYVPAGHLIVTFWTRQGPRITTIAIADIK
jgi:hypothetical protein